MGHNPNREELMLWAASLKEREAELNGRMKLSKPFGRPIPIVRVKSDSNGVLKLSPKALAPQDINEDYWESLLRDRRVRTSSFSEDTLGMFEPRDRVFFCVVCKREVTVTGAELFRRYGNKYQMQYLAHEVLACLKRFKACKADYRDALK